MSQDSGDSDTSLSLVTISLLYTSIPVSFLLAFAIGANDVANSFATSFGSKVLTLRQCCILATIFETLGSILLGMNVSETLRKGVFELELYANQTRLLALGYFCALIGSALWNLLATLLKLPVSGTHSVLGAVLGFHLLEKGFTGIKGWSLLKVVSSWFLSPMLAALFSIFMYLLLQYILRQFTVPPSSKEPNQLELQVLPLIYALCFLINAFSILFDGPSYLTPNFDPSRPTDTTPSLEQSLYSFLFAFVISCLVATLAYLLSKFYFLPYMKKRQTDTSDLEPVTLDTRNIEEKETIDVKFADTSERQSLKDFEKSADTRLSIVAPIDHGQSVATNPQEQYFKSLQVLSACFASFAHGANDVSNAIGPLIALFLINQSQNVFQDSADGGVPVYLFLFGGFGISCGVWALGRRVIETIGQDLSKKPLTPSVGFTVEFASSLTVLVASKLGLPISTTHCKVGSVVSLAWLRKRIESSDEAVVPTLATPPEADGNDNDPEVEEEEESLPVEAGETEVYEGTVTVKGQDDPESGVNWKLCFEIGAAWILTLPLSALFSAASYALIKYVFFPSVFKGDDGIDNTPFYGQ